MAVARYLIDKSALARAHLPAVASVVDPLLDAGLLATCGMVQLEVLYSARNVDEHDRMRAESNTVYEWLHTDDADFRRAIGVQSTLAGSGRHRAASLPDLLIAAVAERHGVTVLHYDADFDLFAEITGQPTEWVAPRGSLDESSGPRH
jgi:predicted nucleic acid-binding protein